MIHSYEKELIVAYFQGGNAKDKSASMLKELLDTIKEAAAESSIRLGRDSSVSVNRPHINPGR